MNSRTHMIDTLTQLGITQLYSGLHLKLIALITIKLLRDTKKAESFRIKITWTLFSHRCTKLAQLFLAVLDEVDSVEILYYH